MLNQGGEPFALEETLTKGIESAGGAAVNPEVKNAYTAYLNVLQVTGFYSYITLGEAKFVTRETVQQYNETLQKVISFTSQDCGINLSSLKL